MKNSILFKMILLSFFISVISCDKTESNEEPENTKLVRYTKKKTPTKEQTTSLISFSLDFYPEISEIVKDIKYDVDVYTIEYKTSFKGYEIIASGVVYIPVSDQEFPLVSLQIGTNVENKNAPSLNTSTPSDIEKALISSSSTGNISMIADGIGFGKSSDIFHPYHHKESSNNAVIDMIKATQDLLKETKANSNGELFILGYSLGGWATLSVLEHIEKNSPLPGLSLIGASVGAGAYDLNEMLEITLQSQQYPQPYYLAYIVESQIRNGFTDKPLDAFFKEPYSSRIPELFDGINDSSQINSQLTQNINELMSEEILTNLDSEKYSDFKILLDQNSIKAWNNKSELRLYHGTADLSVPITISKSMVIKLRDAKGGSMYNVELIELEGLDHSSAAIPWVIDSFIWLKKLN